MEEPATEKFSLFEAFLALETAEECEAFVRDLCTPAEIAAMKERWRVAQLLDEGGASYRELNAMTNVSLATIGRVARFLKQEDIGGYRLILERLNKGDSK